MATLSLVHDWLFKIFFITKVLFNTYWNFETSATVSSPLTNTTESKRILQLNFDHFYKFLKCYRSLQVRISRLSNSWILIDFWSILTRWKKKSSLFRWGSWVRNLQNINYTEKNVLTRNINLVMFYHFDVVYRKKITCKMDEKLVNLHTLPNHTEKQT